MALDPLSLTRVPLWIFEDFDGTPNRRHQLVDRRLGWLLFARIERYKDVITNIRIGLAIDPVQPVAVENRVETHLVSHADIVTCVAVLSAKPDRHTLAP